MIFSSNFLKRWFFQKGLRQNMIFLVLSGKIVFFSRKHIFLLGQEVQDDLCQEIHGNMIFSVCTYGCYKRGVTPLCQKKKKNQRWSYPAKIHLNMIDVLDWHPRKSSSNFLYFHGDLSCNVQTFSCIALQRKKKQET